MPNKKNHTHVPFFRRRPFIWSLSIFVGLILLLVIAFKVSPWPSVLLVRMTFDKSDRKTLQALQKYTPTEPISVISNQQYAPNNRHAFLDVYMPQSLQTNQMLPVVIWTHGGAWVSGDKTDDGPYFKLLASKGFIVASVNYTLAPAKKYPAQLIELNAAQAYLLQHAAQFHINQNKLFLAGDSAGSHLSAIMDTVITNPSYAKAVGITPVVQPKQLAGTVLFCGIYKMASLTAVDPSLPKIISWGNDRVVWAFSGTKDWNNPIIHQMSPYYYVTSAFPATFISGGNKDPLTTSQSIPLASKLASLGIPVTNLFYPADHTPGLPHEYQFNLDTADGQSALNQMVLFLQKH